MTKKKHWPLHSQISGTVWFAAVLIVILALVFFFIPQRRDTPQQQTKEQKNIAELQKMEDSVYSTRREKQPSRHHEQRDISRHSNTGGQGSGRQRISGQGASGQGTPCPYNTVFTRKPLQVELNGADTTTLQLLHGIGPAFARRIVRYRERLGGFCSTNQLLEVYGFTQELLDHISPYLILDSSALEKININTEPLKRLIKHPYMEYYFARDLVNLRSRGITFSSPDDLRTIPSCSDTLLARLLPYIDFQQ